MKVHELVSEDIDVGDANFETRPAYSRGRPDDLQRSLSPSVILGDL